MRLLVPALLLLLAACRSTDPYVAPEVPPGALELVLTDDEPPRTLYASAWGAFARFGWSVESSSPEALRVTVRPPDLPGALDVYAEEQVEGGRLGHGRLTARAAPTSPDPHAVLEAAAAVLATVPGRITVR